MLLSAMMSGIVASPVWQMCRNGMISVWQLGMMCRGNAANVAEPELPASTMVVTPAYTSARSGLTPDRFGDRRVARSEAGRVRRVIDDRRAQRDHLAHALHAVGQHRHRFAVLAGRLHQSVTVLVQDLALPRRPQHAEVLGQVRGPENGEGAMSTRAKSRPAAWSSVRIAGVRIIVTHVPIWTWPRSVRTR